MQSLSRASLAPGKHRKRFHNSVAPLSLSRTPFQYARDSGRESVSLTCEMYKATKSFDALDISRNSAGDYSRLSNTNWSSVFEQYSIVTGHFINIISHLMCNFILLKKICDSSILQFSYAQRNMSAITFSGWKKDCEIASVLYACVVRGLESPSHYIAGVMSCDSYKKRR